MSINFPTSPSNGDVHSGFVYDSTLGVWNVISALAVKKFAVTAGSGVYVFSGDGTTADNNPTLYLTRGETYEFDVNASGHPFYINTSNSTGTSNAYSDGVTNNGTASGTIKFVVQMDAPDTLHYNCQYHSSMNAPIYILDRVHSINDLSDVDTTTAAPTDGQALVWDNSASKWEPGTISSGSSYANSDVDTHLNTGTASANEVLSWTGSDYDWVAQASGGGASVSVSDSAPSSPSSGDLWWDSSQAMMFIYYADGSSNQWVKANPSGSGGADIAVQETAPSNPSTGDLWFDPATLKTYVYYNDGNSNQWVQTNPTGGGGSGSSDVVDDTTPQLGGNLDVNGNSIVSASNGDIPIAPNGSGKIVLDGLNWPTADGSASQVLKTDGSGQLSFVDQPVVLETNRNKLINSSFDIWQRGTSITASGYTADRWRVDHGGGATATTTRQAFTLGQTDVPDNPDYYLRSVVATDSSADTLAILSQRIESVKTFAGQTVTVSFYAKADAAKDVAIEIRQEFGTGGSPSSQVAATTSQTVSLTTSWARYTKTFSISSISGKTIGSNGNDYFRLAFWLCGGSDYNSRTNSLASQAGTFEFAQVQIEKGSVATQYEQKTSAATELECFRYYQLYSRKSGSYNNISIGRAWSNQNLTLRFHIVTPMRASPSVSFNAVSNLNIWSLGVGSWGGSTAGVISTFSSSGAYGPNHVQFNLGLSSTYMQAGAAYLVELKNQPTNDKLILDAEL